MTLSPITFGKKVNFLTSTRGGAFRYHIIDKDNSRVRWVPSRPDLTEYRIRKFCAWDLPITPKWELHDEPPLGFSICPRCDIEYAWLKRYGERRFGPPTARSIHFQQTHRPPF